MGNPGHRPVMQGRVADQDLGTQFPNEVLQLLQLVGVGPGRGRKHIGALAKQTHLGRCHALIGGSGHGMPTDESWP